MASASCSSAAFSATPFGPAVSADGRSVFAYSNRAATRRRGHFPSEQAALKVLYLVIKDKQGKSKRLTGRIEAANSSAALAA